MVSSDNHVQEPFDFYNGRIDGRFTDRLPHISVDEEGTEWLIVEGWHPQLVKPGPGKTDHLPPLENYEDMEVLAAYTSRMDEEDLERATVGMDLARRRELAARDGADYEILFPMKGITAFCSTDPEFVASMCHAWNLWALEAYEGLNTQMPMAMIPASEPERAIEEVQWAADNKFKGILLPTRPVYGPLLWDSLKYNDPRFEGLWDTAEDARLPITLHVATSSDPRAAGGQGGAIINFLLANSSPLEPLLCMIASGVFQRHPRLIAGAVESNVGWIPSFLEQMDYCHHAHHMWVRPVLPELPSIYFRNNCFATFSEDHLGMQVVEPLGLEENFLWANDFPHHEGSWPHSAEAIERQMGNLTEETRKKILGLNAARIFQLPVPEEQQ